MKDLRQVLFQYRSYTPIPFLIVMVAFAEPGVVSFAVGLAVTLIGEGIRFWGVAYAGSLTRVTGGVGAPSLIVAGPFARMRNPLYVGNMIMYVGIGLMANALTPWLVVAAGLYFFFQYSMIVSLEEDFLSKEFGEEYHEYRKAVPRFIPRLTRFTSGAAEHQLPSWREGLRSEKRTLQALVLVTGLIVLRWVVV